MSHFVELLILIASPAGASPLLVFTSRGATICYLVLPLPPSCLLFFKHSWVGLFLGLFLNIQEAVRLAQPRLKRFQIETRFTARNIYHTILFPRNVILVFIYKIILNNSKKFIFMSKYDIKICLFVFVHIQCHMVASKIVKVLLKTFQIKT